MECVLLMVYWALCSEVVPADEELFKRNKTYGDAMHNTIPDVQKIMIPIDRYPCIREDEPIGNGVALILEHSSADNQHLHYEELIVIDGNDQLVGMLNITGILSSFFPSIMGDSSHQVYFGKKTPFTDLSVLLGDNFRVECRRQALTSVNKYMRKPHRSIDGSMSLLHALEIMIKDQENTLPVTENGILLGAVRVADIFRVLGGYCTI
jgi:CBS domain-containing protein